MGANGDRSFIEHLVWDEVARRIADGAPAILPIGAASKQHGFHLPLDTDRIQAEWFAARLAASIGALIWPTLTYGHYPAFVEYAGSSSLSSQTFEAVVYEIAAPILEGGCQKLFVLDTGISTLAPVARAIDRLPQGMATHLRIHDGPRLRRAAERFAEQPHGSHADEIETSLMLALAPHLVDMSRAEASPPQPHPMAGPLTPSHPDSPNYSRSGSYGDPTRATLAKGEVLLAAILEDIDAQASTFMAEGAATAEVNTIRRVSR